MNTLLKSVLKEVIDIVAAGKAIAMKDWAKLLSALIQGVADGPAIIAAWPSWKSELEALLHDPAADADLLAAVMAQIGGEDAKAKAIIQASVKLVLDMGLDIRALVDACQMAAPAAAPQA